MKLTKKRVLSIALIVIMIAILSFSSLAWFTDSQTSENKFNIAGTDTDTDEDPDDIFSIDVKEEGEDGDPVDEDEIETVWDLVNAFFLEVMNMLSILIGMAACRNGIPVKFFRTAALINQFSDSIEYVHRDLFVVGILVRTVIGNYLIDIGIRHKPSD